MERVLVCGGRGYDDIAEMYAALDALGRGVETVISGMARGADTLAARWARERGKTLLAFPADWTAHGKAAGPIRNTKMLVEGRPTLVVAFPGGPGTADMLKQAKAARVPTLEIR